MKQKILKVMTGLLLMAIMCLASQNNECRADDRMMTAKKGVVEIQSGYTNQDGKFFPVKNCSGFLINNSDNNVYIVTIYSGITITEKEEKAFYKANKISKDSGMVNKSVRLIVKGDVSSELSQVASSETSDFCILNSANIINEKSTVSLENVKEINAGDEIYTLGFQPQDNTATNQFLTNEVSITQGSIQEVSANISGKSLIQHTANIDTGNSGGITINSEGYVVGMNNAKYSSNEGIYFATPVSEIIEVLNNYGIIYQSREREKQLADLEKIYKDCEKIINSDEYALEDREGLQSVLENAKTTSGNINSLKDEEIKKQIETLTDAKTGIKKKISKVFIYMIIFALVDLGLVVWLVIILIKRHKKGKNREIKSIQETDSEVFDK